MKIIKTSGYQDLSKKAAIFIAAQMIHNPRSTLGLATGSTPEGVYAELAALRIGGVIDFADITTFNLDEYYGLPPFHPRSYRYYMREKLFQYVNIKEENIHIPDGSTDDAAAECARYEKAIRKAGGIDLQLLGIGRNGHIGFNEPSDSFARETYLVDLTEDTLEANARFFAKGEEMPKKAISMGINTIMQARGILLIACGEDKKEALRRMIEEPVTPMAPASVLQFHRHATIMYCD
ncbi:MAG: glucosamine-6-phosphate deaminase [Clostridiales bacterium]|nr:glucosamine-6-phosphate deaminase [Clostridiales bacterium]